MVLHQNCQFGAAIINGTALAAGTYSYSQLSLQFPGNFAAGGFGSIQIVPPAPVLSISASGTSLSIAFSTLNGRTYTLQTKDSLDETIPWAPVGNQYSGDGTMKTVLSTAAGTKGFFRVLAQ